MKTNIKFPSIVIAFIVSLFLYNSSYVYSAMSGDNSKDDKVNLYNEAKRFVVRAKKLEKKNKVDKAIK